MFEPVFEIRHRESGIGGSQRGEQALLEGRKACGGDIRTVLHPREAADTLGISAGQDFVERLPQRIEVIIGDPAVEFQFRRIEEGLRIGYLLDVFYVFIRHRGQEVQDVTRLEAFPERDEDALSYGDVGLQILGNAINKRFFRWNINGDLHKHRPGLLNVLKV
jgi:hypothetical protein